MEDELQSEGGGDIVFATEQNPMPADLLADIEPYQMGLKAIMNGECLIPPRFAEKIDSLLTERRRFVERYRGADTVEEKQDLALKIRAATTVLRHLRASLRPGAKWRSNGWGSYEKTFMSKLAEADYEVTDSRVRRYWDAQQLPPYVLDENEKAEDLDPAQWQSKFREWALETWKFACEGFGYLEISACEGNVELELWPLKRPRKSEVLISEPGARAFTAINAADMVGEVWEDGVLVEETDQATMDRAMKLMAKALHKKEIEGWTPEQQEAYQSVVKRLNQYYLRWRRKRLTKYYYGHREANLMESSKEGLTKFLRETGKNASDFNNKPHYHFFLENILPTVVAIAGSVEDVERIGRDAIEVLDSMLTMTWTRGTRIETDRGLQQDFFADYDPTEQDLSRTHISSFSQEGLTRGQFKYFYPRYGKEFTKVVALHDGWRSDIHYGDGFNEFLPYGAVENGYGRIAQLLGPERRDEVFALLHQYLPWEAMNAIATITSGQQLPVGEDAEVEAKVLRHLLLEEGDHGLQGYSSYLELCSRGFSPQLAACIRPEDLSYRYSTVWKSVFVDHSRYLIARAVPGIEPPSDLEDIQALVESMVRVNQLVNRARKTNFRLSGTALEPVNPDLVTEMRAQIAEIDRLCARDEIQRGFSQQVAELKVELERVASLAYFRRIMGIGLIDRSLDPRPSSFLRETNPVSQMAIAGAAFMLSIGAMRLPELGVEFQPVRAPVRELLALGSKPSAGALEQLLKERNTETQLRRNAALILPALEKLVMKDRMTRLGTMAGGVKLHTTTPMDGTLFDDIRNIFGLDSTSFRLIHADKSLIIPPLPGNLEPKLLMQILGQLGVINVDFPELQTTMAGGDWPQDKVGIVCASILLATQRGVRYKPGAFTTSQNGATDARIMARDAGVMQRDMPFHLAGTEGRTDKLGGRHYSDIDLNRFLGTLTNHGLRNGLFAHIANFYEAGFLSILKRHGLEDALHQSDWVFDPKNPKAGDSPQKHEQMVARFTDAWFQSVDAGYGIVDEVEALIHEAMHMMEAMRPIVEKAMPEEVEKQKRY